MASAPTGWEASPSTAWPPIIPRWWSTTSATAGSVCCAESLRLRPITTSVQLEVPVGSPEQQAVEDWLRYGAPFHDVPGAITSVTGPPGLLTSTGLGRFSFMVPSEPGADRPDLEIRLLTADDTVAHTLDLVDVRVARGVDGPGVWLSGTDRSGVLEFRFLLNGSERNRVRLTLSSLVGETPADVLPAVQLVADLPTAAGLVVAVRGGRPLTSLWRPEESEVRDSPLPPSVGFVRRDEFSCRRSSYLRKVPPREKDSGCL